MKKLLIFPCFLALILIFFLVPPPTRAGTQLTLTSKCFEIHYENENQLAELKHTLYPDQFLNDKEFVSLLNFLCDEIQNTLELNIENTIKIELLTERGLTILRIAAFYSKEFNTIYLNTNLLTYDIVISNFVYAISHQCLRNIPRESAKILANYFLNRYP